MLYLTELHFFNKYDLFEILFFIMYTVVSIIKRHLHIYACSDFDAEKHR